MHNIASPTTARNYGYDRSTFLSIRNIKNIKQRTIVASTTSAAKSSTKGTKKVKKKASTSSSYNSNQIQVLKGLEPVRKRPGMHIGSTGVDGYHHLIWEVIDNSVDEALAGHASYISLEIDEDEDGCTCTIQDDGRGIPVDEHPVTGVSALETVLTVLHAGGKFDDTPGKDGSGGGYKVSGGLHGVGISVVNALSSKLEVMVDRDDTRHTMLFARGFPTSKLLLSPLSSSLSKATNFDYDIALQDSTLLNSDDDDSSETSTKADTKKNHDKKIQNLQSKIKNILKKRKTGTTVTFLPDNTIFKPIIEATKSSSKSSSTKKKAITFDVTKIIPKFDEIAYLNPNLILSVVDHRKKVSKNKKQQMHVFSHEGGLEEYINLLTISKTPLFTIKKRKQQIINVKTNDTYLSVDGTTVLLSVDNYDNSGISINIALKWSSDQYSESILSFVNNIRTKDGGTHVEGLKVAITRTINSMHKKSSKSSSSDSSSNTQSLPGECIREGLTAIISIYIPSPEFEGQTKSRLGNPEVRKIVESFVSTSFTTLIKFYSTEILNSIVTKANAAQAASAAARAARDFIRRKNVLSSSILPGKLADCSASIKDDVKTEIFIVEGDSAAGSAKQGRDRMFQAILPLRGKILNIERATIDKIYNNVELQGLISALGLTIKNDYSESNDSNTVKKSTLRYDRIIIMTDADVDGAHIRVLLLTFFYRYQRELIEDGYVYIAQPPLYKIKYNHVTKSGKKQKKEIYVYTEEEKLIFFNTLKNDDDSADGNGNNGIPSSVINIQRFKGLGEMMANQLWTTTMDPKNRKLLQVTLDDAVISDRMCSVLMGDNVAPRREFIRNNADDWNIVDLDV